MILRTHTLDLNWGLLIIIYLCNERILRLFIAYSVEQWISFVWEDSLIFLLEYKLNLSKTTDWVSQSLHQQYEYWIMLQILVIFLQFREKKGPQASQKSAAVL